MRDRTALFVLLGLTSLFFFEPLFTDRTFVYRDIHLLIYPMKHFAKSCINSGFLPFWNPYILCGAPFLAQVHHQTLYPLSAIVYLFPFPLCMDIFVAVHIFLSGLFFYYLMKDHQLNNFSSLFSAITYAFCGVSLSTGNFIITLSTATWTPLLLLFYLRALRRESLKYAILSGTTAVLSLLSGTPAYLYLDILLLTALTAAFSLHKKSLFPIKAFILFLLSTIALSLFQLLPFLQLVLLSNRAGGVAFSEASLWSLGLYELLCILIPAGTAAPSDDYILPYIGQKMTTSLYFGVLPVILAISAPFWIKRRSIYFWLAILILSLILCAGKNTPLYYALYKILPGFSMLKNPIKAMHTASVALSILAGFSFSQILKRDIKKSLFLFLSLYIVLWIMFKYTGVLFEIAKDLHLPYRIDIREMLVWREFVSGNSLKCALFLTGFLLLFSVKNRVLPPLFCTAVISLATFDLYTFGNRLCYYIDEKFYKEPPSIVRLIGKERFFHPFCATEVVYIGAKVSFLDFCFTKERLFGNLGMIFGLYSVSGYESLYIADFISLSQLQQNLALKIMGTRHIVRDKLWYVEEILERPSFFSDYKVLKREDILDIMKSPEFDAEREIILEEEPEKMQNAKCKMQSAKCEILEYSPNKVVIKASCPSDGFLFLSDTYYPEWRCYVDGKYTKIYRANYCFRAVELKKGEHRVEFLYFPKRFIIGLIGSVLSGIMIVGLFLKR